MTKLQFLNVFLTERLMLAAQEIYKSVEDTILEYQEEIAIRERENDHLRRRLRDAGIEIWPGANANALTPIRIHTTNMAPPAAHPRTSTPRNAPTIHKRRPTLPICSRESRIESEMCLVETQFAKSSRILTLTHNLLPAASNNVECPHQKSPIPGHMSSSFCCKVCGEAFSHMGHLHVHVQVHTREKPYRCGVCGKCCSSSGRLQEHQRSHTGEKPFRCQICGKGFTQMAHLKVHMRIHTGEKPYSCPVCGKCFSRSDKIKRHLQTHNRDGQYFSGQ
uniref:C2H2-type domain-containing protein n=1 Tax=Periophthalmus magnuspinnatus TaxID=409849 RepID=A0A3B3ZYS6_9GOBI